MPPPAPVDDSPAPRPPPEPPPPTAPPPADEAVLSLEVDQLQARLGASVACTLAAALALAPALGRVLPASAVIAWLALLAVVQVARLGLRAWHRRRRPGTAGARFQARAFTVGAGASGLAWAAGPIALLGAADPAEGVLMALVVVAVTAMAVAQLASSGAAVAAFVSLSLLPVAAWLAVEGGTVQSIAAGVLVVLWAMLVTAARAAHRVHRGQLVVGRRLAAALAASDAARAEAAAASARVEVERRRLANVVDGTGIGVAEWQADDGTVRVSPRLARMLGHEPEALRSVPAADWEAWVHPEDRSGVRRAVAAHVVAGRDDVLNLALRLRRRDGGVVWTQVCGSVVARDAAGRPAVMTASCIDVTERKLESQRWQARAELSADWFWETDEGLRVSYVTSGQREGVLPVAREAMMGRRLAEVPGLRPPEPSWGSLVDAARERRPFGGFVVQVGSGPATTFVELQGRPRRDVDGGFAGFEGTGRDVTDKVRAVQQLRDSLALVDALFDTVPIAIAQKDTHGRTVRANRAFQALLGIAGRPMPQDTTTLADDAAARVHREVDRALLEQPGSRRYEVRQTFADGRVVDALIHKATLCDADGRIIGLVGTQLDISDQKAAARALADARDAAEQANRAKSFFLATMSHELRTPLNAVIGAAQLLRSVGDDAARRLGLIEAVEQSGASLLGLIENVMDLSRIEAGAMRLGDEAFDLSEAVESAVATAAVAARHKGIAMACVVDPALVAHRQGDPLRVRQLMLNLLGNAVKFTPSGEVVVRVGGDEAGVVLEVIDTGVGIPAQALPHIFDRFSQADQGSTRRFGGSGLGLAIVHELVTAMDGRIAVDSRVGHGTRFRADLPLRTVTGPAAGRETVPSTSGIGVSVAWYEPHAASAEALAAHLERLGCDPVRCLDPADLRAFLARHGEHGWFLCAIDGPDAGDLLACVADRLDPMRVIGMSPGATPAEEPAHASSGLHRRLLKPVLRSALVSRLVGDAAVDPPASRPAVPSSEGATATTVAPGASAASGTSGTSGARILLVEDDPTNRVIIGAMLEGAGHRVDTEADGHAALRAIGRACHDLVLMDWQMPGLDGLSVTRRARAGDAGVHGTTVPIVALTANAFAEDRLACLPAGRHGRLPDQAGAGGPPAGHGGPLGGGARGWRAPGQARCGCGAGTDRLTGTYAGSSSRRARCQEARRPRSASQ